MNTVIQKLLSIFMSAVMFLSAGPFTGGRSASEASAVANNEFALAGYELTLNILSESYDLQSHKTFDYMSKKNTAFVWPVASLIESAADAYRLFPGSLKLKRYYRDILTNGIDRYLVKDAVITAPEKEYSGISYYNSSAGGKGDYYYDDNEWVCIQLLLGYSQLKNKDLLSSALRNLEFLWTGWDSALDGGIYWSSAYESKNACSNAPAAIAFLLAYQLTGNEEYLEKGRMIYDWMNSALRENDLFIDNIQVDSGAKNHWKGIYNQATMIYAGSLLYEITGEEEYYNLTAATVRATIPHMFTETQGEDGSAEIKMNSNPIFKAWCVGWLARSYEKFYTVDPERDGSPMEYMAAVLRQELLTKDEDGFYDPFFCSGAKDDENYTEILAQDGVASAFLCTAYYEALLKE
ncbi:MAG: hypothetical protein IJM02_02940 [Clostridia bacterium]|nr:hypothetical protein [Clostridia bacterium]